VRRACVTNLSGLSMYGFKTYRREMSIETVCILL